MSEFIETSEHLASCIADANKKIDTLSDQLRKAEHEKQKYLDEAVMEIAQFKVGQEVLSYKKRYRITKVYGEEFALTDSKAKIWLRYQGVKLKVNGEPTGRVRRLYDVEPV